MNIVYCDDYESLSARAAALVITEVEARPDLLLCVATGRSTQGLYQRLVEKSKRDSGFFDQLSVVNLDEWGGIAPDDPGSCSHTLRERLLEPLGIPPERFLAFAPDPADPALECERIRAELDRRGPIDVCILGLGVNGHVGLNEPGPSLIPHCHVAQLSETSRRHAMIRSMRSVPMFGLTLGMREILASRTILLLVAGDNKRDATATLLEGSISTTLPASLLWLHKNVECLIERRVVAGA